MIKAFDLQQGNLPLLVSMPHPGTLLTPEVAQGLTPRAKRLEDTDWNIPLLYQTITNMGASTLCARYSRRHLLQPGAGVHRRHPPAAGGEHRRRIPGLTMTI